MRYLILYLSDMSRHVLSICFIMILFACNKKVTCHNPNFCEILFYTNSVSDTIKDTSATIVEYVKGSNFTQYADSFANIHLLVLGLVSNNHFEQQYIPFTLYIDSLHNNQHDAEYPYKYDRIIKIYPSGRTYRLTKINHNNRTIAENNTDNLECTNDVSYVSGDSLFNIQGDRGSTVGGEAILLIKY